MQTLSFLGAGRILTKWAAGLYRSIAAIYTDMLNLVDTFNDSPLAETLNNISANVYVLVGVFMLFRIGVSLLNYLVDPSKLDDKKVGGGQLVTHILISIVLLLSLNFVFKWTNDLQTILLERDGILYKIISTGNAEMSKLNDLQLINTQEVSVVSKKYKDNENICNNTATIKAALKEHIINNIRDGCFTKKYTRAEAEKLVNSVSITYNSSGRELTGISGSIDETSLKGLNAKVSVKYKNQVGQSVSGTKPNFHLTNATCYFNFPLSRDYSDNSLDSISGFHVEYYCDSSKSDEVEKSIEGIENKKEQQIRKDQGKYDNSSIEESGFEFATITLSTFMSPSNEVDDTILKQYSGEKSSDWWADRIEDEQKSSSGITYSMDWLLAIICGLAIIVVLLAIMIEVVVRNLKLVFLQAIAPIPVISYMNPNDKMLGTWVKQYIGVYFSLFLQLLAILLVPDLMMNLLQSITGGFILKIIIIAGCLLFTKEAPKFISKLLGLESISGTFGDALKMVKTGLGLGAKGVAAVGTMGALAAYGASGKRIWESGKAIMGSKGAISTIKNVHGASKTAKQERIQGKGPWWHKDYSEANKSAATAYSDLDKAMDGAMFSSNKAIEQIQKFYDTGTVEDKIKNYKVFGVSDEEWAKTGGNVEEQLRLIDKTWGDRKNNERAKIFVQAIRNVQNGTASAFDQNIVSLSRNLEVAESGTEVGATKFSEIVNINDETQAVTAAAAALKTAKEHSKSGYKSSSKGYSAGSSNTTATISTSPQPTVSASMGDNKKEYLQSQNVNQANSRSSTSSTNEDGQHE